MESQPPSTISGLYRVLMPLLTVIVQVEATREVVAAFTSVFAEGDEAMRSTRCAVVWKMYFRPSGPISGVSNPSAETSKTCTCFKIPINDELYK